MIQAVILAGGKGTRLRPLTDNLPKPMVRVKGRPFLEYQLRLLKRFGVCHVVLLVGYLGHMIKEYFQDGSGLGLRIIYSEESQPLGTGGALRNAEKHLEESFLLVNGDTWLDVNYRDVVHYFKTLNRIGVVVVYSNQGKILLNNVCLDSEKRVVGYKKQGDQDMSFVDAGVSAYKRDVLAFIPKGRAVSLEQEVFPQLIAREELWGYPCDQRFHDMGTFRELEAMGRIFE